MDSFIVVINKRCNSLREKRLIVIIFKDDLLGGTATNYVIKRDFTSLSGNSWHV